MKKVFLSYTRTDKPFAERLSVDLKKIGLEVWLDAWEIKVGDSIIDKVDQALGSNDYFLIVLSPAALKSRWVKIELNTSFMRSLDNKNIKIIPILLQECEIPNIISDLKYADFTTDYQRGFNELMAGFDLISLVPAYSNPPKTVTELIQNGDDALYKKLFPFTFSDFPQCLFRNDIFDIAIVVGSTERERANETEIFSKTNAEIEIFGTKWKFSRQSSPGTVRDAVRVVDLASYLGFQFGIYTGKNTHFSNISDDSFCFMDISTPVEVLERNLILVGGADTNIFIAIAALAFRQKFGYSLPIRYFGDDQLYFTCDQIFSEMSGQTYSRLEDSRYMHCGYVLMVANPWSTGKVIIFVIGTRATGTQAALLSLLRGKDQASDDQLKSEPWHLLGSNNRFNAKIPGKVIRASEARIIETSDYLSNSKDIRIYEQSRISQRHIITNFEFLE